MPNPVHTVALADTMAEATVGSGIGGLRGWGAALVVVLFLGGVAWWAGRRHSRR